MNHSIQAATAEDELYYPDEYIWEEYWKFLGERETISRYNITDTDRPRSHRERTKGTYDEEPADNGEKAIQKWPSNQIPVFVSDFYQ